MLNSFCERINIKYIIEWKITENKHTREKVIIITISTEIEKKVNKSSNM
jgi:hypothetical protein